MKIVLQKVKSAKVTCGHQSNEIKHGYMLLVGVANDSIEADAETLAKKIAQSRLFADENDKINLSIQDVGGEILSISQFTLLASVKKGNRPSFTDSANKDHALTLYEYFNDCLKSYDIHVKTGFFGEMMNVELVNNGPITIIYESKEGKII